MVYTYSVFTLSTFNAKVGFNVKTINKTRFHHTKLLLNHLKTFFDIRFMKYNLVFDVLNQSYQHKKFKTPENKNENS